jgi:hypothetical protein
MAVDSYSTKDSFENSSGDVDFSFNASTGEFEVTDERKLKSRIIDVDGTAGINLVGEDNVESDVYVIKNTGSELIQINVVLPPSSFSENREVTIKNRASVKVLVAPDSSSFGFTGGVEGKDFVSVPPGESLSNYNSGGELVFGKTSFPVEPETTTIDSGFYEVEEISDGDTFVFTAETPWDTGDVQDPFNRGYNEFKPSEFDDLGDGQKFTIENRTDYPVRFPESEGKSPTEVVKPNKTAEFKVNNDSIEFVQGDVYDTSYEIIDDGTTALSQGTRNQVIGKYVFKFNNGGFDGIDAISILDLDTEEFVLVDQPTEVDFPTDLNLVRDTFYFADEPGGGNIWKIDLNDINPSTGEPYVTKIFDPGIPDSIQGLSYYVDIQGNEYLYFIRADTEILRFDIENQTVSSVLEIDSEIQIGSSNIDQKYITPTSDHSIFISSENRKLYVDVPASLDTANNKYYKQIVVIDIVTESIDYYRKWEVPDDNNHSYIGGITSINGSNIILEGYRKLNLQTLEITPVPIDPSVVGDADENPEDVTVAREGVANNQIHFNTFSGDPGRYVYDLDRQRSFWWAPRNRGERPTGRFGSFIGEYKGNIYFTDETSTEDEEAIYKISKKPLTY